MWDGDIANMEQVALYLNTELQRGRSQKDIEVNDFKVSSRVMEKRLKHRGYKKINNQYILGDSSPTIVIRDTTNTLPSNTKVVQTVIEKKESNPTSLVLQDKKLYDNIVDLAKNYDKIMLLLAQYDNVSYSSNDSIAIELPVETKKDFRTTIRINNIIWDKFDVFANKNKIFTKRDLLSMALKEYIDKYDK